MSWRGLVALISLVCTAMVHAHGLRLAVVPTADGIAGQAWYSDETPAAGDAVWLESAQGQATPSARTDAQGRFTFQLETAGTYTVVAEGEEGHRAEARLDWTPSPVVASPAGDAATWAAQLRAELQPLREDLARYERRIRLHDLLGGLGLIVGLSGFFMAWRARTALRQPSLQER